ncbi:MAG: GTP-binding protein [Oscillospiraceae bacterium]|jgi:small GTP-binding protein|nr:GTP-binding protein [Oscillospiraceae bacterium]
MKFKNMIFGALALAFVFVMLTPVTKSMLTPQRCVKVIFLGNTAVGKTALLKRIVGECFSGDYSATIGLDCKNLHIGRYWNDLPEEMCLEDNNSMCLRLFDTAGQEEYRATTVNYIRGSKIAIIVFSIVDKGSFEAVEYWINFLREHEDIGLILVANKTDLPRENWFANEEGIRKELGTLALEFPVYFCSAKDGAGVDDLKINMFCLANDLQVIPSFEAEELRENKECC